MMTVHKSIIEDQATIIQMISSDQPLNKILQCIVNSIENYCDTSRLYGSIMLYNPLSNKLEDSVSNSLPANFINAIEPVDVSPYGGSSGAAAYFKHSVIVTDIENNPLWEKYRHIAMIHGFRACWANPLFSSNNELLGTIELYSNKVGGPDAETLKNIEIFSELASLAIEASKNNDTQLLYEANKSLSL